MYTTTYTFTKQDLITSDNYFTLFIHEDDLPNPDVKGCNIVIMHEGNTYNVPIVFYNKDLERNYTQLYEKRHCAIAYDYKVNNELGNMISKDDHLLQGLYIMIPDDIYVLYNLPDFDKVVVQCNFDKNIKVKQI